MSLKEDLHKQCSAIIQERLETITKLIQEHEIALLSETKSSAGDKHETGRAMLHLQREKSGIQLSELLKVKDVLNQIDTSKLSSIICLGSIVRTSDANYFISISVGKISVNDENFYAISTQTPIGQILMSKIAGDQFIFREKQIEILDVL